MGFKKRKRRRLNILEDKLSINGKIIEKKDEEKVKGGKVRKHPIWVGAGGITPD